MKERLADLNRIRAASALALFNFIFLGTEYLFDNMMTYVNDSGGVVLAQSYILGASAIGFLLFAPVKRFFTESIKQTVIFVSSIISIICIFLIEQHTSYEMILLSGCILFILLGIAGSAVHYLAACVLRERGHLARTVGTAYAVGLLLQFVNNNVVDNDTIEAVILSIFLTAWVVLGMRLWREAAPGEAVFDETEGKKQYAVKRPLVAGITMVVCVILMTCIFATLDNVVTLYHAAGSMDIGQWPRLLLALSGLVAGFLFDIKERRYMNIIMYCVTLLSTMCVLIIVSGGPFLIGLVVFYLSAGFFVVFFTTGFMDLSYYMKMPAFWAGLGRATNNLCAVVTGTISLALIEAGDAMRISIIALALFALISVMDFIYANQLRKDGGGEEIEKQGKEEKNRDDAEKFLHFAKEYALTVREQDVLKMLLTSDDSVQEIADSLFISRAALYRHITSINEKTETKSRIGLLQFYYAWKEEKWNG